MPVAVSALNEDALIALRGVAVAPPQPGAVASITGVDWSVRRGEFWVVGGLHGAGKSDLLATAAGLQKPAEGTVLWSGRDLAEMPPADLEEARRKIGLVFDRGGRLFRDLSVAENIALPLRYHFPEEDAVPRVEALLQLVGLADKALAEPSALSVIWQQRAALARALALRPSVLFQEKPTADWQHLPWWQETLTRLTRGEALPDLPPMAVVLATDEFTPWREHATHFALLKNRRWELLAEKPAPEHASFWT